MATRTKSLSSGSTVESRSKKTRQGRGNYTKLSATSRNGRKKRYRGQGK